MKLARQHVLDAMNFRGYISSRQPRDFPDGSGIQPLKVGENHVPIQRLKSLNECEQALQGVAAIDGVLAICRIWKILQLLQTDQFVPPGSL